MQTTTCDGCGRRIADDDPAAVRRVPGMGRIPGAPADWCGDCAQLIRTELPKWAAQARDARRAAAAEPVRTRALRLWEGAGRVAPDFRVPPASGAKVIDSRA